VNFLIFILFVFFSSMAGPAYHPIHVSVCNVELNGTENIVSVKLFKDDFALALKNNYQISIPMDRANEKTHSEIISKYINSCFQIESGQGKTLKLVFKTTEINEEAIWVYFNAENFTNLAKLRVKNTLMLDLWDDQTNLVILNWKGKETGYRFNRREVEIEIDLNK